jgi:hypothetical protein
MMTKHECHYLLQIKPKNVIGVPQVWERRCSLTGSTCLTCDLGGYYWSCCYRRKFADEYEAKQAAKTPPLPPK